MKSGNYDVVWVQIPHTNRLGRDPTGFVIYYEWFKVDYILLSHVSSIDSNHVMWLLHEINVNNLTAFSSDQCQWIHHQIQSTRTKLTSASTATAKKTMMTTLTTVTSTAVTIMTNHYQSGRDATDCVTAKTKDPHRPLLTL